MTDRPPDPPVAVPGPASAKERPWCECDPDYDGRCPYPCAIDAAEKCEARGPGPASVSPAERDELRRVLYEAARSVPVSSASVHDHAYLQSLHRRMIAALGEEEPADYVRSDYWLGRTP